jgi:antitoxin (DNA-binding transcriptional repressor) of toxin-antitoxin stability system
VAAGETIEVSDRGRPVALLAPIAEAGPLERLRAAGELSAPRGDLGVCPRRSRFRPGQEPSSLVLERLRRDER